MNVRFCHTLVYLQKYIYTYKRIKVFYSYITHYWCCQLYGPAPRDPLKKNKKNENMIIYNISYMKTLTLQRHTVSLLCSQRTCPVHVAARHSKVCLCTKNSSAIYHNQTPCMGRGTWGALCVLPPCGEIAVNNTPPLLSVLVDSGWALSTVHPLPPLRGTPRYIHSSTFTTFSSWMRPGWNWLLFSL